MYLSLYLSLSRSLSVFLSIELIYSNPVEFLYTHKHA